MAVEQNRPGNNDRGPIGVADRLPPLDALDTDAVNNLAAEIDAAMSREKIPFGNVRISSTNASHIEFVTPLVGNRAQRRSQEREKSPRNFLGRKTRSVIPKIVESTLPDLEAEVDQLIQQESAKENQNGREDGSYRMVGGRIAGEENPASNSEESVESEADSRGAKRLKTQASRMATDMRQRAASAARRVGGYTGQPGGSGKIFVVDGEGQVADVKPRIQQVHTLREKVVTAAASVASVIAGSNIPVPNLSGVDAARPSNRPAAVEAQAFDFSNLIVPSETQPKVEDPLVRLQNLTQEGLKELGGTDKKAFLDALRPGAEKLEREHGVPAAVTLAQAGLESAWGQSVIDGYNIFGVKGEGPAGSINLPTKEVVNGNEIWVNADFRKYHNFLEAIMQRIKTFEKPYPEYEKAMAQYKIDRDPIAFGHNIAKKYATDPAYGGKIEKIIKEYNLNAPRTINASEGAAIPSQEILNTQGPVVFPIKTTQEGIKNQPVEERWCFGTDVNCHHSYNAMDFGVPTGTPVLAMRGGTVISSKNTPLADCKKSTKKEIDGSVGDTMSIKGEDGIWYYYAHMKGSSRKFKVDDKVKAGDVLGVVGTAAEAQCTSPHLHSDFAPVDNMFPRPGDGDEVFLDFQRRMRELFALLPKS